MADGLHQVSLAESSRSVDEERVVEFARSFGYGVGGGGGELVGLTDDEVLEGIALIERLCRRIGGATRRRGERRHEKIHLGALQPLLVDAKHDRDRPAERALG